jgi:two-component system, LytTR family, sensor kinase
VSLTKPAAYFGASLNATRTGKRRWVYLALYIGIWSLPGLMSAGQVYSEAWIECKPIAWWQALVWQVPIWYFWALLAPLILWLGRRFPLERQNLLARLLVHIPASVLIALLYLACTTFYKSLVKPAPLPLVRTFYTLAVSYLHFEVLVYWAILGIGYAFVFYRRYHERELATLRLERQLTQAQLQALKMQLHPHFLFNTLNALAVLVRKQDTRMALSVISRLSELLRYALDQIPVQEVPLRQELDFIRQYIEIEQIRFTDRLSVQLNAAPETLDALLPNFILQPLVENAIRHGVAASGATGLLEINAARLDGHLKIEVRDNGPGLKNSNGENGGIGLANTRTRLQQLYGTAGHFELRNANGHGAVATLTIPFHTFSEASGNDESNNESGKDQNSDR